MKGGTELIISLGIIFIIAIYINILLRKNKKKHQDSITHDWDNFLAAASENNIVEIKQYGDKLIWNTSLNQEQLSKITEVVEKNIDDYPELEKLKLDAFNKQLNFDRTLPGSGSSGGIKQSWFN